jgi:hypothetical protein
MLHTTNVTAWITSMVSKDAWSQCVEVVKQKCAEIVASLIQNWINIFLRKVVECY